jgi:hypothetical protein
MTSFAIADRRFVIHFTESPVQKKRALALQQEWGEKPCDHPAFAKEYDEGERTGNFFCTQCGAPISFRQRAEILATRSK